MATNLPRDLEPVVVLGDEGTILREKLQKAGIRTVSISSLKRDISILSEPHAFVKILAILRKEKPDLVHLNSSKAGGLGALAARLSGIKKIVFTVHGFAFSENRARIERAFIKFLSYITLLLATDIIFINKKELADVKRWPLISHKCRLIYNGISILPFIERENAQILIAKKIKKNISFFTDRIMIGSIGELTKNKGYDSAIETFKKLLSSMIYIIIGDGELRNELERQIKESGLQEKVFLAGFVDNASNLLQAFDIFLLPSRKEGLPYVLLEAGAAKLPVVASAVGGIPEIIEDQVTGFLVKPDDISGLAKTLSDLVMNPRWKETGQALKEKVITDYNLKTMIEKTVRCYRII